MNQSILVTGAAGQLGQRVIHHLLETYEVSPSKITAATRNPEKLADIAGRGVRVCKADFDDVASLESAFAGVDRLLIISTDAIDRPGVRIAQHKAAVAAAVRAGVRHLFYTSMPAPENSLVTFAPDHLGTETAIKASGLPHTIFRNAWYMDNFLHSMPHNLQVGNWYTATGNGRIANISREDCAIAIAAALASDTPESAVYTLTGSQSLTSDEIAVIGSEVSGKPLKTVQVDDEQLAAGLAGAGLPLFVVDMLVSADANTRAGNFDIVTDHFNKLTAREPQSLESFFTQHKAALAA